jgi:hypothetical protein
MFKALSLALLLCVLNSSAAAFCFVPQPRLVCAEYFKTPVVVTARLMRIRHVEPRDEQDYYIYSMHIENEFRGGLSGDFRIDEGNDSARASFGWKAGQTYLLFLTYDKDGKAWELDGCGNSGPLSKAAKTLREIEKIKAAGSDAGGEISGEVDPRTAIFAKGEAGVFRGRADADGNFRIHVPAGVYSVRAVKKGFRSVAYDFSYEDPRHVRIENGGCGQVKLGLVDPKERKQPAGRGLGK